MNRKKGQIGLGETVAVIIVFIMIVVFGFIIYTNFQRKAIEKEFEKQLELRATEILTNLQSIPEIQCSSEMCSTCGGSDLSYSYDWYKAVVASSMKLDYDPYYVKKLGSAYIAITIDDIRAPQNVFDYAYYQIDSQNSGLADERAIDNEDCSPNCDYTNKRGFIIYDYHSPYEKSMKSFDFPVTVYDSIDDMCYFGSLKIGVYS